MASPEHLLEKGLPANVDAERFVLGSIMLDDSAFIQVAGTLEADDFSLEKHRRIFLRMADLAARGEKIDRVTVANELMRHNQLEACDGLSYLVSLDDGLPQVFNLDSYVRIIKDKSILRRIVFASQTLIDRALLGEDDPGQILASAEDTLLKLGEAQVKNSLLTPMQVVEQFEGGINAFLDPSKRIQGLSTGFKKLDEMTNGFHEGELIILAARPAMGKTAFAMNIAQHVVTKLQKPVAVFSLEMSNESLLTRMICAGARVDQQKFRAGYLNQEERRRLQLALSELVEAPLFLDDTPGVGLMDIHAKLRRLQSEHGLSLVVIDYLQLMQGRGRVENRNQEVSAISRGLKLLSKELRVPFLVLSQLSRATETRPGDHRPQVSDLRESGCLTGDSLVTLADTGARVPIESLVGQSGFAVWAINPESLKLERAVVQRAFATGTKPVFRMTTRLGRTIRATANHKFLTISGWKRLDELAAGERLALPRALPCADVPATMSDTELALLGHLLGDGCTLPRHVVQYTTKDDDLAELVASLASEMFGAEVLPRIQHERGWKQVYLSSTRRHTHGVGNPVADWLKALGAWGLRSYEKRVPARVFAQPAAAIGKFLRHLWATDGCLHFSPKLPIPRVYYGTSSKGLAYDVQALLLRLGINARVTVVAQQKGRPQYPVTVSGKPDIARFISLVGAVGVRKSAQLQAIAAHMESLCENTNRDVIPNAIWRTQAVPSMQAHGITTRQMMADLQTAYCGTGIYRQNVSRARAARLAQAVRSEVIARLAASDIYWDEFVSAEPDGVEPVYDLTVPGPHNFVANDIIVHNSIEQDADVVGFIFREEVYKPDREDLKGLAKFIIAKQRNGPTGDVNLVFLREFTKFENRANDLEEEG